MPPSPIPEEQITGVAEHGGLQIIVYPMRPRIYVALFGRTFKEEINHYEESEVCDLIVSEMGLAPGGLMRQKIYEDKYFMLAWDQNNGLRCFVHFTNSEQYLAITGHAPPHQPPTAADYTNAGLPWFDYYSDGKALAGSNTLGKLTSVAAKVIQKGKGLLSNNEPLQPKTIKIISKGNVVRDGEF